jgi:hypothetical protein
MLWIGDHSNTILPKFSCLNLLFQNKCRSFYHFKKKYIFRNGEHIEWRAGLSYILLKGEAHNDNPCKKTKKQKQKNKKKYLDNLFKNTFIILTICEN